MSLADIDRASLSPMMQQYAEMKESLGDTFLFYRLGDFYEMFFDDAVRGSKIVELALTKRDCGSGMRAPMCGVPFHAYRSYADKLVGAGYKVAICEQLEDPALAKGLVKRGLTRILTPGTITDGGAMEDRKNNFLMSVMCIGSQFGIAVADISTGDFEATQLTNASSGEHFINLVSRYSPSEIIHNRAFVDTPEYKTIKTATGIALTLRNERDFSSDVVKAAGVTLVDVNKFSDPVMLKEACGAVIGYAKETQTEEVAHLKTVRCFTVAESMELDYSTRTNLELTQTIRSKQKKGSLLWAIDRTATAMGGRLLRKWVEEPLISVKQINRRLDAVAEARGKYIARQEVIEGLYGL